MEIVPIILTGGLGKRLWPISRSQFPKQLTSLVGEQTMLQNTAKRIKGLSNLGDEIIALCNEDHKFLVANQLSEVNISNPTILVEPVSRNTAIAIFIASLQAITNKDPKEVVLLVLPSDHLIQDIEQFHLSINKAAEVAMDGKLVTLGVTPNGPSTLYGYIKKLDNSEENYISVEAFIEKPNLEKAEQFIADGNYLWNSGMFLFRADILQDELNRHSKEITKIGKKAFENAESNAGFIHLESSSFKQAPDLSIDYALMEKTDNAAVIPLNSDWNDLGSWQSLHDISPKDKEGNASSGDVILEETKNSYIRSEDRLIVTLGMEDMIVVDTADVTFITNKNSVSKIDQINKRLKQDQRKEKDQNRKIYRPWGWYDSLESGEGFQVKRISVSPGSSISLQKHEHRSEHWIVVKGKGKVTNGEETFFLEVNQSTYIEKGTIHRLENLEEYDLEIIEVQSGGYLGEDDIVRFDDIYGR